MGVGQSHHNCPDTKPIPQAATIEVLGQAGATFTTSRMRIPWNPSLHCSPPHLRPLSCTGILIGIGETRRERLEALAAVRRLHERYGHVQELIVQVGRSQGWKE